MDSLSKWKCAAGVAAVTAAAGWSLFFMAEKPADSTAGGRGIPVRAVPSQTPSSPAGGVGAAVKDARTGSLLNSLAEITADARTGQVSQRFLQEADRTLFDNNFERRRRNFGLLMEHLRPEDAPHLHEVFIKLHREGRPFEEYSVFASRWGEIDGAGAIAFLRSSGQPIEARDFDEIMKGWGQTNPSAAMQFLSDNADFASNYQGETAVLRGWARHDADAATRWLTQHGLADAERLHRGVAAVMLEQLYGQGMEKTAQWLAALPDDPSFNDASRTAWHMHLGRFNTIDPQQAVTLWKSLRDQPWMQIREFERFYATAGRTPERGEALLTALAGGEPGKVAAQFQRWAVADPTMTSEWLAANPGIPAAFREEAIRGLVAALQKEDPAAAAEWQRQLPASP